MVSEKEATMFPGETFNNDEEMTAERRFLKVPTVEALRRPSLLNVCSVKALAVNTWTNTYHIHRLFLKDLLNVISFVSLSGFIADINL